MIFNLPSNWSIQDISDQSVATQILQAMAQRHYAAEWVPRRTGFASFPRYWKPVVGSYHWSLVQGYHNITFQNGTNMQNPAIWSYMQNRPNSWRSRFVRPMESYDGLSSMPVISSWEDIWEVAGIPGYRKVRELDVNGNPLVYDYGLMERGDIIGPWIAEDISAVYEIFTHRYFPGILSGEADHDLFNRVNCSGVGGTNQAGWEGQDAVFSEAQSTYSCSYPSTGVFNLCWERMMGRNFYEPVDPPDPFLPHEGQRGYWQAQYVYQRCRPRIDIRKAGQDINDGVSIKEILYHSVSRSGGAPLGVQNAAIYKPLVGDVPENTYVLSLHRDAEVNDAGMVVPDAKYTTFGVPSISVTGDGPSDPLDPNPPEKTNYEGGMLRPGETNVIFVMGYKHGDI